MQQRDLFTQEGKCIKLSLLYMGLVRPFAFLTVGEHKALSAPFQASNMKCWRAKKPR